MCVVVCGLISRVWLVFNGTKITLKSYTEKFTALDFSLNPYFKDFLLFVPIDTRQSDNSILFRYILYIGIDCQKTHKYGGWSKG